MKRRVLMAAAMSAGLGYRSSQAQTGSYPSKPIRGIVPFSAGSASDVTFRVFCDLLSREVGQPVVVDNRPGANAVVGMQALKAAPADGYTLGFGSTGMYVNPLFIKNLAYSLSDFREIAPIAMSIPGFIVAAQSPYKTLEDAIAASRKRGTSLQVGTYTTTYQLGIYWLAQLAGIVAEPVLYKGGPEIVADLLGGSLELSLTAITEVLPLVREGKLRLLATTGGQPTVPGVPIVKASYPDYEFSIVSWFIARVTTPDPIVDKLSKIIMASVTSPEAKAFYERSTATAPVGDVQSVLKMQGHALAQLRAVAEKVGIKPQ